MKTEELIEKSKEMDDFIRSSILSSIEDTVPILDGVIDPVRFLSVKYKILWILKEPYDYIDENGVASGGHFDLKEVIRGKNSIKEFSARETFKPIINTSWGLLNNFHLCEDNNDVETDASKLEALKSISLINVKKLPGRTTSAFNILKKAYGQSRNILLKQIELINPDIIIFGSTFSFFNLDLGVRKDELTIYRSLKYTLKNNKVLIDAYHPGQRSSTTGLTKEQYCNDIIYAVSTSISSLACEK